MGTGENTHSRESRLGERENDPGWSDPPPPDKQDAGTASNMDTMVPIPPRTP
jgi:hypothetical protein